MAERVDHGYETWSEKFKRKFNENPWVPIGCLATTGALLMSSIKMKAGKSQDMQYWLRARVALQGLTIVALVAGSMALQAQRKEKLVDSAEGQPRNEATTEIIREQKRGKEKAEFEERLRGAEIAHAEEQASARIAGGVRTEASTANESNGMQGAVNSGVPGSSKSSSSWTKWFWKSPPDDPSKKS
ncbi:hypothetical protein P691DRAFT_809505 [Macrolepiota fuliginosa MF-IS2]|uniref:HIG1 domain-containing protein n=1 Tax=Macrolepiota fuliginosa MF-IS2 TaxID=1400762 RepID=A0A9P5XI81_9AGAR|nr:hypothetical protein P691DRAFT_809505 [Macrolepiota fuliginosa MF-IS2]